MVGCPRAIPLIEGNYRGLRNGFNTRSRTPCEVHTDVLSMFWGLDCLCELQIIHNVPDMRSEYVRLNAVIVHDSVSRQGWVNRKANGLAEPARLAKY